MKIFIQVIDTRTGIYQTGMIDEPAMKGQEIGNALAHFGVSYGSITWDMHNDISFPAEPSYNVMSGRVDGTTKIVSVVCY